MKNKIVVAITGTIGCGKSTLCNILHQWHYDIISTDKIGHELLPEIKQEITSEFGKTVLTNNRDIDKKKLSSIVFANPDKLLKLNAISHPKILQKLETAITKRKKNLIFVEIPPVFSVDIRKCFDLVVQISSPSEKVKIRLQVKDKSFLQRINSQKNNALIHKNNYIIKNDGDITKLEKEAKKLVAMLQTTKPNIKKPFGAVFLPKICLCVAEPNFNNCQKKIEKILQMSYLVELRLDYLKQLPFELNNLNKKRVVGTLRTKKQGGKCNIDKKTYAENIYKIDKLNFEYIDIEIENADFIDFNRINSKIILSYHNFDCTPQNLEKIVEKMAKKKHYLLKIATMVTNINDNFALFSLLKKYPNLIAFGMGEKGELSRILSIKYGSTFTYSYLSDKNAVAPGQIDVETLNNLYNLPKLTADTAVFGLIGQNISKSFSRAYHNKQFAKKDISACFVNFPIDSQKELQLFLKNFRAFNWQGAAVTMPFKQDIFSLIDKVDTVATKITAVNTLKNNAGKLTGYNTDWKGAIEPLLQECSLSQKKVLLLGNGGAARAILFGLLQKNAIVSISARDLTKNRSLSLIGKFNTISLENAKKISPNFDMIINATKVGMNEEKSLLTNFRTGQIVMDIVYQPKKTKMLHLAELQKATIVYGEKMLFAQAEEQQKIWFA